MKITSKTIKYTVETVEELSTIVGKENDVIVVTDENRGGTFVYRSAEAGTNNGGTIFDGWVRQYNGAVNVKWFGAVGDGVTDDINSIQKAVVYIVANNENLEYSPEDTYYISKSILIPQRISSLAYSSLEIDGKWCYIRTEGNISVFESAYDNAGVLTSSAYSAKDTYMSFGIIIKNFNIRGDSTAVLPAIAINSYHQGCSVTNINSRGYDYFMYAQACYYSKFTSLLTLGTVQTGIARFVFIEDNNLMEFNNLVAVNADIGYKFIGLVDACEFHGNSLEGQNTGLLFTNGEVRGISIQNNYIEGFTDVAINFNCPVLNATVDNNYINNLSNGYFIDYLPGPNNNINIGSGNSYVSLTDDKMFKTINNTIGYNKLTFNSPLGYASSNDSFLVDNTNFSNQLAYNKQLNQTGLKAKVVNKYAEGVYGGRYTNGYDSPNGFKWINNSNSTLTISTKFTNSPTGRIYVNLRISAGGISFYASELVSQGNSWKFFKYDTTSGVIVSTDLTVTIVDGFIQINGTMADTILTVNGEIRLV